MIKREVAITGIGFISPVGKTGPENWENVKSEKTGITRHPKDGVPALLEYQGRVPEIPLPEEIPPKLMGQMKFLNRGALLGFCAAHEAMQGPGGALAEIAPERRALYVASGDFSKVGYDYMYPAMAACTDKSWQTLDPACLNRATLDKVNPFFLLESLNNNLFSFLSADLEFMGPSTSLASLSPSGGNALELAARSIRRGTADMALAVGYGSWVTEIPLFELEGLRLLSRCREGAGSFKPFDRRRDGFITGEGGAAIVLEAAENAARRGADILGRVEGFANAIRFDTGSKMRVPTRVTLPAMAAALDQAGLGVDELGFIIPHGSGTLKGDRSEMASLLVLLGKRVGEIPLCGLKPYSGHLGAASDLGEIVLGLLAAREGRVPATLHFKGTEAEFKSLRISAAPQACAKKRFLSVSYGLGGQSTAVVVSAA